MKYIIHTQIYKEIFSDNSKYKKKDCKISIVAQSFELENLIKIRILPFLFSAGAHSFGYFMRLR